MKIELLSPAKNLECGTAAINCGADAIYIGAPKFGARSLAGNTITDIATLVNYAHTFGVKIYVTLNTILYDDELEEAEQLINQLYEIGVDALLIQDLGILQLHLPPIALHASTQTDNRTVEKVKFLKECGFTRVVLARETPIETIRTIHQQCDIELEAFVHGALCVSYSGQCYMSEANCQRSANRGCCAQYCRLPYTLQDADGNILLKSKHLLSLKDLNRSQYLDEMMNAGICSFKIEGRLKDADYVKNVTAYYRKQIDNILEGNQQHTRSSYGNTILHFIPNVEKSFNRGFTDYFLHTRDNNLAQFDTPKSKGEYIGEVLALQRNSFTIQSGTPLHNGDGLCYVNSRGQFTGFRVNRTEGHRVFPATMPNLQIGDILYRNLDYEFQRSIEKDYAERRIGVDITLADTPNGILITAIDESGIKVSKEFSCEKQLAQKVEQAESVIRNQMSKLGNTIFYARSVTLQFQAPYFFPSSILADWRKQIMEEMNNARISHFQSKHPTIIGHPTTPFTTTYRDNISNSLSEEFYLQHGTTHVEPAYELKHQKDAVLMHCKYCLKHELGWCHKQNQEVPTFHEPLYLNYKEELFQLHFDCQKCEMFVTRKTND